MVEQYCKNFSVNNFDRIKETSQFNAYFTKSHNNESDAGYLLEVDIQYS